jgi:membrane protein implicated in regulation of membrane protease activity
MILLNLGDWWAALTGPQQAFWGISIVFSILFLIQFVFSLIGLDMNTDLDGDIDVEASGEFDSDFTLLSVRSIIAFFTFFGWTGVLILNAGGSTITAVSFAALAGLVAMAIVGYLIYLFSRLSEDGNVDINNALLNVGKVYLTIPAEEAGQGKIHITIDGSMKELNAITKNMEELPTGSKIRVIEVLDNNILIVEPIEKLLE